MAAWSRRAAGLGVVLELVLASALSGCTAGGAPRSGGDTGGRASASSTAGGPASGSPSSAPDPRLARFYDQRLRWTGCRDGFECARVVVPVDYGQPDGPTLELSVNRLRAPGGDDRIGSLLINPGGPGASGLDYARAAHSVISSAVRRRFDVVGFDPRGVGASAPIRCLTDAQTDAFVALDASPDDAREQSQLVQASKQLGARCAARNGPLLEHVGTRDAARDLDVLRAVVGDARLNFLGKSYGTYLGATYAEIFPDKVGRIVLDGVVDPAVDTGELARAQAVGFETALRAFVADCLRRSGCPLSGSRAAALRQVSDLLDAADRSPLKASRPVGQSLALLGVAFAMYEKSLWQVLRSALGRAEQGDGSLLLLLADSYAERNRAGHYPTNSNDVIYAVTCLDRPEASDLTEVRDRANRLAAVAPRFGAYVAWSSLPCGFWPVPPQGRPHPVRAAGAAPILVVGTTRDPATPYVFSKNLAAELESGRLLTYVGDGHTAYRHGSGCIDGAVDRYLTEGSLPEQGARCD